MVLILKELAASSYKLNCLQISPWSSVSTQTEELKKQTVISVMLPKEENVLFTSFMAVTAKQDKKNQAFDVFVLELKSSCPSSVCPSLATFGKSWHFEGSKTKHFSFLFVKLGDSLPRPLLFPFGEVEGIFPLFSFLHFYLRNKHRQILYHQVSSFLIPLAEVLTNSLFYFLLCSLVLYNQCCWFQGFVKIMEVLWPFLVGFLWFLCEKHSALGHNLFI